MEEKMSNLNYNKGERLLLKNRMATVTILLLSVNVSILLAVSFYAYQTKDLYWAFESRGYSSWDIAYNKALEIFGAKNNEKIFQGEYWRFITPMFLHGGVTHLFFNAYSIYALAIVERIFGSAKYIFVYLMAGIMGNVASFIFSTNPSVGASGAIFGLMGALLYLGFEKPKAFKRYFGQSLLWVLGINLVIGFQMKMIDNFAHLGGLLGGFLAAGVVRVESDEKGKILQLLFLATLLFLMGYGIYSGFSLGETQGFELSINE